MTRRTHMPAWRPSAAASCLAIAACAATPPAPVAPPAPATPIARAQLAQRGHGDGAAFALCRGDACPQRTPKTLAPAAVQSTAPAASATPALPRSADVELEESTPPPIASVPAKAPEPPAFEQVSVHFPFASAQLGPSARAALREVAPRLAQASEITLSGRTDSPGPAATNDGLAKARAQAVLRQLLALSPAIAPRVSVDAQGACCYAESNDSPAGRANNRRVEIRYRIDGHDPP